MSGASQSENGSHPMTKPLAEGAGVVGDEKELLAALRAICDLAQVNFPRNTDIRVSVASGVAADGSVTIPKWLLTKLINSYSEPRP